MVYIFYKKGFQFYENRFINKVKIKVKIKGYTKGFIFGPNEPQATPAKSMSIRDNMNMPAYLQE